MRARAKLCPSQYTGSLRCMSRCPDQSEAGPPMFKFPSKLDSHLSTHCTVWSRDGTALRRSGSEQPCGATESEDRGIRRMAMKHRTAPATEIRTAVGTTVIQ
ncbi:hypothetical protein TNCV_4936321 [Trichonephila clavipes]|nr:hypothetical protein TNCV_4936321 [Trichonephila clavipes]